MGDDTQKKKDHPIFVNVVSTVTASVILLFCTTIYNLFLAHIWPVTIHFGEYSLNNFIFILVSVISSIVLAVIILSLEMLYVFSFIASGLTSLLLPPEKRAMMKRKSHWYDFILSAFLWGAVGVIYIVGLLATLLRNTLRKEEKQSNPTKEAQGLVAQVFSPTKEQSPQAKQTPSKEDQERTP
jgi:magnesium-transporting ATPase (P-type)